MTTLAPCTEQRQHFTPDILRQTSESNSGAIWRDTRGSAGKSSWVGSRSRRAIAIWGMREYERSPARTDARNGFYIRSFVTRLGPLQVCVARTAAGVSPVWSRQAGAGGARDAVVDPRSVRARAEPARPQHRREPRTKRLGEGLLQELYRRGLEGRQLQLIVTDGCPGLATALQTVSRRVAHQRCWVHKLRNLWSGARRGDHTAMKADAQAIYRVPAESDGGCRADPGLRASVRKHLFDAGHAAALGPPRVAGVLPVSTGALAPTADDVM